MEWTPKSLGARLRMLRQQQGMTIDQLAEQAGLPPESISRIERGRTAASLRSLDRMGRGLGLELHQVLAPDVPSAVRGDDLSPEVRGVALLLRGQPPGVIDKAQRIIGILVERD